MKSPAQFSLSLYSLFSARWSEIQRPWGNGQCRSARFTTRSAMDAPLGVSCLRVKRQKSIRCRKVLCVERRLAPNRENLSCWPDLFFTANARLVLLSSFVCCSPTQCREALVINVWLHGETSNCTDSYGTKLNGKSGNSALSLQKQQIALLYMKSSILRLKNIGGSKGSLLEHNNQIFIIATTSWSPENSQNQVFWALQSLLFWLCAQKLKEEIVCTKS